MTQHRKVDTGKWIQECLELYEKTVEHFSGKRQDPGRLEQALAGAKAKGQVGPKELQLIEESSDFPYPQWWREHSNQFGEPLALPERLDSREEKENAVSTLQERVKHIEVVSIILRFLFPEEFGIMSPPVTNLLNLVSLRSHEEQYLRYLSVLEDFRQHYGLERIADVDMALWVAAHRDLTGYGALSEEMHRDEHFQKVRLKNMVEGLGRHWERTERARLTLAEVLLEQDHVLAALVAARCFESWVKEKAREKRITTYRRGRKGELHDLVQKLEKQTSDVPPSVSLDELRKYRISAVHHFEPPISKNDARKLVTGVQELSGE